jgi:hypothetical protein
MFDCTFKFESPLLGTALARLDDDEKHTLTNPSSRIRRFLRGPLIVYQWVGRKSLHYRGRFRFGTRHNTEWVLCR